VVRVEDDGVGLPQDLERKSGLKNIEQRATALGGSCTTRRAKKRGGTIVEWRVPLA
jgi:signal transduction histidine kinase